MEERFRPRETPYVIHHTEAAIAAGQTDFQIGAAQLQNSLKRDLEIMWIKPDGRDANPAGARVNDYSWRISVIDGNTERQICRNVPVGQLIDEQTRRWDLTQELPEGRRGHILYKHQGALRVFVDNQTGAPLTVHFTIYCFMLGE